MAAALVLACWVAAAGLTRAQPGSPTSEAATFVRSLGDRVLALLAEDGERDALRYRSELRGLARENFDLEWATRFVLGRHWPKATAEQREELLTLFPEYAVEVATRTLLSMKPGAVEGFRVVANRPIGGTDVLVETEIALRGSPRLVVSWRVRGYDGDLKVIDAVVVGVSMALTLREVVDSVISRKGIDGLAADVRAKLSDLRADGG